MAVQVRMFAALREAAGCGQTHVAPGALDAILAALRDRYGEEFSRRLPAATVLVDGRVIGAEERPQLVVRDGAEVALLPPVSGGAPRSRAPGGGRPWPGPRF
ncbi:MAG TPA: MoaD/ThiS family protein [Egibacteraceae bacterium]|nr:MoaD/ThiS family protein [Egibacteraceae bacterium]